MYHYHLSRDKPAGFRFRRVFSWAVRLDQLSVFSRRSWLTGAGIDTSLLRPHNLRLSVQRNKVSVSDKLAQIFFPWLCMLLHSSGSCSWNDAQTWFFCLSVRDRGWPGSLSRWQFYTCCWRSATWQEQEAARLRPRVCERMHRRLSMSSERREKG